MNIQDHREFALRLLTGQGAFAACRSVLSPAGWLYGRFMELRRNAYRSGKRIAVSLPVPVISVGNLTVGGTGKTPMVEWVARSCAEQGRRVAIISRGYGAKRGESGNDEALLLARHLGNIPHFQNADRVSAGRRAIQAGADCLVLDDAFQRVSIGRNLNIVLLDALFPFGGGRCLPAGLLREPVTALADADVVILTRADAIGSGALASLRKRVRDLLSERPILETGHRPKELTHMDGRAAEPLHWLRGKRAFLFCGLGNPRGFVHTVERLGVEIVAARFLPDHYDYGPDALKRLAEETVRLRADCALTTEKDIVKMSGAWPEPVNLRAVRVEMEFLDGRNRLEQLLKAALTQPLSVK